MTRPDNPKHLSQAVELQVRREELSKQIHWLEGSNSQRGHVYFLDGEEMFDLSLNRDTLWVQIMKECSGQ